MKKLYPFALAGFLAFPSFAQTQKGQSITSGTVNLSFYKSSTNNPSDFKNTSYGVGFLVNRGVFVKENWLLGYTGGVTYQQSVYGNQINSSGGSDRGINLSGGIFLRRYWSVLDRLYVYAGGGLTANRQTIRSELDNGSALNSTFNLNWQIAPTGQVGALYALSNRIGVEATISNSFPTGLSNVNIGVAILSGQGSQSGPGLTDVETPQTQKGRWLLGASANVSGSKTEGTYMNLATGTDQSGASAGLSGGRFMSNNLLIGLAISYAASRSGDNIAPGAPTYSIGVSPFVRSYRGATRLRPFMEGRLEYGVSKSPFSSGGQRNAGGSISAGLAYMAGNRFIIQTTLGSLEGRYNWYPDETSGQGASNYSINARATTLSNISVAYSL